jgi:hypothetical protein
MDNAFNHRDLRVEEDVSDLQLVSYFGGVPHHLTIFSPVVSICGRSIKTRFGIAACVYALVAILNEGFLRRGSLHSI